MRNLYILAFGIFLLASSCRKEKFKTESRWIAPLLETELTIGNLVPDSLLTEDNNGNLSIVFEEEYGVSNLDDILQIPDRVEEVEVSLTSLVLDDRSFTDTLTLAEIYPPSILLNGRETTLEAQDIVANEGTVLDVTEQFFTTATFLEGFIDISISNDLPVVAEELEFQLRNDDDKSVILSGVFTNLAPSATVTESYDLAGKTVDGVLELIVNKVKTAASVGEVLIEANKGIRTTITVRDLKPQTATAIFPAQNLVERSEETKYEFGGAKLTEVHVKEGFILMKVESSIEEAIILDYTIPNSEKIDDPNPISRVWTIPAAPKGETIFVEERFPIAGFVIFLKGQFNNAAPYTNHIYNQLTASIDYSGIERTLSLDDKIKIEFGLVDVKPSLVFGDPGYHEITVKDTLDINLFKKVSGNLSLDDAILDLEISNTFGIESTLNVKSINAVNTRNQKAVALVSSELIGAIDIPKVSNSTRDVPIIRNFTMDKSNSNLKLFLQNMPDQIVPDMEVVVNPNGTFELRDFAFETSELKAKMALTIPYAVGLDGLTFSANEGFSLFEEDLAANIVEGELIFKVENEFPIEGVLKVTFEDDQGNIILEEELSGKMESADIGNDGRTTGSKESELILSLDRSSIPLIKKAARVGILVTLNTEDGKRIKLYPEYSIGLNITTKFTYENTF